MIPEQKVTKFAEMNYCQNKNHYIYNEKEDRYFHKSDTAEMRACIEENFKKPKIFI